ncbi:hypothetical protein TSUD_49360 [Trifolium subterraneum]|uniref:Uncharacterized protein n=1 Tax=Trifolium subterraneum TaxID=3900 RepID=A0A2Z6N573_TRISU|nr:hypothetical protein TSUD_49360 [Trifolium subterraneum]
MSDQEVTENREDSLEESNPKNLTRTLTISRNDDYNGRDEEYDALSSVDDLQKEILAVKGSLTKVNEKLVVEQTKNAKPINKDMMDSEISREIDKERFEIKELIGKRLQVLKDRIAKVMAKYGTVLEPSPPASA